MYKRQVLGLCERFSRLRQVSVESAFPEQSLTLQASPFLLMHLFYRAIDFVLAGSRGGSTMRVGFEAVDGGARVTVAGDCELTEPAEVVQRGPMVEALAQAQGCTARLNAEQGQPTRVVLELPLELKSAGQAMGEAG